MFKGNVVVSLEDHYPIVLHTAKCGLQIPKMVHRALKRSESKWGNSGAVARVLFGEMTSKDPLGLDGFSIASDITDNDNFILSINDRLQKIGLMTEGPKLFKVYTFEKFLELDERNLEWKTLHRDSYDYAFEHGGFIVPSFCLNQNNIRMAGL